MIDLVTRPIVIVIVVLIRLYQKTFSLDHGPAKRFFPYGRCKFYPSCSEYSIEALNRHGLLQGLYLSLKRVLRCHPWSAGGHDPVK